jgi:uncharacterized protein with HEPN domain
MSERDPAVALRHMRDAARRAVEIASPLSREHLHPDVVETLALSRLLEIPGEGARRVPDAVRSAHPGIPWRQIVGTRDRLIHGYDQVDLDILWTIVREQLPPLIVQLEAVLRSCERD